jgi:hypothetical protein
LFWEGRRPPLLFVMRWPWLLLRLRLRLLVYCWMIGDKRFDYVQGESFVRHVVMAL